MTKRYRRLADYLPPGKYASIITMGTAIGGALVLYILAVI